MGKKIVLAALAALVVAAIFVLSRPEPYLPPENVQEAVYSHLRSLGCVRKEDGTWNCPPGALE